MDKPRRSKRSYDHRIKLAIARSGNHDLFPQLNIPRSTAKNWINRGVPETVTLEDFDLEKSDLIDQLLGLKNENTRLNAILDLLSSTLQIMGVNLKDGKVPEAERKTSILKAVEIARAKIPLEDCLDSIGLTSRRFKNWIKRQKACDLRDHPTCPKTTPTKIIPPEVAIIKKYVEDKSFSHFSLSSLFLYVKLTQKEILLSLSSWFRIIHQEGFRRPSRTKYFVKPKTGVRASRPNQIWHIDISVFRVKETKYYIQAIRDNFSRLILAYTVSDSYGGASTKKLLEEALKFAKNTHPEVFVDKGPENLNKDVDELIKTGFISRIIAQLDVVYSNSLIESFFNQLKNRYLYYEDINTPLKLQKCVDFYVQQQNEVIPMMSLNGTTPIQAYQSGELPKIDKDHQKQQTLEALRKRIEYRSALSCQAC